MQSTVGEQLRIASPEAARPHPALISNDRLGVEEELEGFTPADIATAKRHLSPLWTSHQDGSLRNGGVEFVTNGGLGGQDLYAAFERLIYLLANVVEYQDTFRCSTHMHVDMLDFTVHQVANFLLVYTACEPYLFEHCGQYRRSSNFCVPVGDSLPFHKTLISTLYEDSVSTKYSGRYTNKYTALNLQPLFGSDRVRPIGTVEFRGGRPMTTMEDFLLQANLLLSIKQFVRNGPSDPEELLRSMGDTVTNSVYANGAAQHLRPSVAELEEAMISSWMLLKAFQQGMKEKPTKLKSGTSFSATPMGADEYLASLGSAPTRARAVLNTPEWSDHNWNSALHVPPRTMVNGAEGQDPVETFNHNPYPAQWDSYSRFYQEFQGYRVNSRGWYTRLLAMGKGEGLGRCTMGEQEMVSLAITWQLLDCELSILPALRRAMVERATYGRRQSLVEGRYSEQPTIVLSGINIGELFWLRNVRPEYKVRIQQLYGSRRFGSENRPDMLTAFKDIATIKVRVKNRTSLREAINGAIMENDLVAVTEWMYASDLYHLMRMAGVPSENHVFRGDLQVYDRVAETMQMLYACGQSVPVRCAPRNSMWGAPAVGNGKLRLTNSNTDRLGLGYREDQEWTETRTARVTVDEHVHIY